MTVINNIVQLEATEQRVLHAKAHQSCYEYMLNATQPDDSNLYCPPAWDKLMCWPYTPAGTTANASCPDYINRFNISGFATRTCTEDGTWYINPLSNNTWTNFTQCLYHSPVKKTMWHEHLDKIRLMYSLGYTLSLVSLTLALFIMLYFKKLHCPRNYVHINLFVAFILRALVSILKESLLVDGVGLEKDIERTDTGTIVFKENTSHWECKLLLVIFNYILSCSYMWIFVEALYLHMLIFVAVFSERSHVHWYMILGWAGPLTFMIPWVIVRALLEDCLCWNTHPTLGYLWIIQGPLSFLILVNFCFFINIVRVLFTKLQASNTCETKRYRKLAKSTLVLILLFGVHYMVFLGIQTGGDTVMLVKLYFEMFFNSFQGLFVAILVCFMNGEVRTEIRKKWSRFRLRRGSLNGASTIPNHSITTQTYINPRPAKDCPIALDEKRMSNGSQQKVTTGKSVAFDDNIEENGYNEPIVVVYENTTSTTQSSMVNQPINTIMRESTTDEEEADSMYKQQLPCEENKSLLNTHTTDHQFNQEAVKSEDADEYHHIVNSNNNNSNVNKGALDMTNTDEDFKCSHFEQDSETLSDIALTSNQLLQKSSNIDSKMCNTNFKMDDARNTSHDHETYKETMATCPHPNLFNEQLHHVHL